MPRAVAAPEPPEEPEIEFYDIPAAYQERLLRFLQKSGDTIEIWPASSEAFYAKRVSGGPPSYAVSLEDALNDVMRSRAETKHVSRDFELRVLEWLNAERAELFVSASGNEFVLEIRSSRGVAKASDEDLEVALVFAEEEIAGTVLEGEFVEPPQLLSHDESEEPPANQEEFISNTRWSRAYVNSLPDTSFLYVEPGGKKDRQGRSHPLSLRHLPYRDRSGRVDQRHLHAALARVHQKKTRLPTRVKDEVFARGQRIYEREFGYSHEAPMAANTHRATRPPAPPPRSRRPMTPRRMIEIEEARHRREERPFDPEARREHYAEPHHFAVNDRPPRGGYRGTSVAEDDYVIWRHNTSERFYVDHIGRGGTHTTIGHSRGYDNIEAALEEIGRDAHRRGTHSAIVWVNLPSGDIHQIGNTVGSRFEWPGRGPEERRRREGLAWLDRRFGPGAMLANARGLSQSINDDELGRLAQSQHEDKDILRTVVLGDTGYVLIVWGTNRRGEHGKSVLGYALYQPWRQEPLFEGEDFQTPGVVDSDETLRGILSFLTLRPGDTDREYFDSYTPEQMEFTRGGDAEELQLFSMEPEEGFDPLPLVDVA